MSSDVQTLVLLEILPDGGAFPFPYSERSCSFALQDWKHHKLYCKPSATESSVRSANRTNATTVERPQNPPKDVGSEEIRPGAERSINVNLGGQTVQIASSTYGPQMMREIRDEIEKMSGGVGL